MKQITCEMCGSTDFMKQDGFFVCQSCGCKYSVEDAKKLMSEVENSKKMANLYERARKSIDVDDLKNAAEYYKEILDENPNDWEAYFYSYLGEITTFTNAQAGSVAAKLGNTIPSAYDTIRRTRFNIANWEFSPTFSTKEKLIKQELIEEYARKVKELDPNFSVPEPPKQNASSSGGCYVATCVYGSYDCPQVWTLRRYRDDTLGATWYGRLFIRTYYAISPTVVKLFGNTNWFKKMWKGKLDRMVAKLQSNGVEDTPYEDKNW